MAMALDGPVGVRHGKTQMENRITDQAKVIGLLDAVGPDDGGPKGVWSRPVPLRLGCPPELFAAILAFQTFWAARDRRYVADGAIDPRGNAMKLLNRLAPDAVPVPFGPPPSPVPQPSEDGRAIRQTNPPALADDHAGEMEVLAPLMAGNRLYPITIRPVYRNLHFRVVKNGEIFWVGAGIPSGTTDFTRVQVYFHPSPENSGTVHARPQDYPTFTGGWETRLKRYTGRAGLQIAAARLVPVIVPYMTMASRVTPSANMFAAGGVELINAILAELQAIAAPDNRIAPRVQHIGVTSFSNGIDSLKQFLGHVGPSGLIREITDLDSPYITTYPKRLTRYPGAVSRCFSQSPPARAEPGYIYLPPTAFPPGEFVHPQIGWQMYFTAMLSSVIV